MRIFGAIGLKDKGDLEALERVMRVEGYMRVQQPDALPADYPFVEYEKCDLFAINSDGPFKVILLFKAWERAFSRALEISRITNGEVFALKCTGRDQDCLKVYDQGRIVVKVGPDDDDEQGLLVPQTDAEALASTVMGRWGIQFRGMDAWSVAAALGVPDVERAGQAGALRCAVNLVFLSVDSPIA